MWDLLHRTRNLSWHPYDAYRGTARFLALARCDVQLIKTDPCIRKS
ncbi:hypothetical protein C4K00_1554 [Pseudomonas synxantha]|uniref:Uncharacterized protein n=1 Tax=Pseudomonas synxantha TaxID=47883 RepID=A0AAU8TRN6_9PSED|nr:hypothetical protein VO64_4672 [Pseudomonas synxantha]AZE71797.1 hypothetical protein C4K00_1554 [Pseudomonas synxantha]AZE77459.1 hypothetical protein C4J99_1660 [Pseudomonas synxantha]